MLHWPFRSSSRRSSLLLGGIWSSSALTTRSSIASLRIATVSILLNRTTRRPIDSLADTCPPPARKPSMPDHAFEKQQLIRFHHCDPAGIVFYPQYLVIFDELIEDWFNEGLGIDFAQFHVDQRIGIPAAHLNCDFLAPSKVGDVLTLRLEVLQLGRSSLRLRIEGVCGGQTRIRCEQVRVLAALDHLRSVPIPDDLRQRLQRYAAPA